MDIATHHWCDLTHQSQQAVRVCATRPTRVNRLWECAQGRWWCLLPFSHHSMLREACTSSGMRNFICANWLFNWALSVQNHCSVTPRGVFLGFQLASFICAKLLSWHSKTLSSWKSKKLWSCNTEKLLSWNTKKLWSWNAKKFWSWNTKKLWSWNTKNLMPSQASQRTPAQSLLIFT